MEVVRCSKSLPLENVFSDERSGWENCPLDVLLMIFENLEPEDLMRCIQVNSCWRDAVSFFGQHRGIWHKLAQAAMVNKGIAFRRRSTECWQDLYTNSRLWFHLKHARATWYYERSHDNIRSLHVYKDILIIETGDDFFKQYYQVKDQLRDVTQDLIDASLRDDCIYTSQEDYSTSNYDRMIKKLVQEGPFKRLLVFDEDCFYLLDDKNVLRCSKWDGKNKRWLDYVLARYYGCNSSISDINVYNNEVYMLIKTGLVFRLDKLGRNFIPERRLDMPQSREMLYSRLLYTNVLSTVEKVSSLKMPQYNTGRTIMFNRISAAVSVPMDKKFKMSTDLRSGSVVLECPGLTCAAQHADVLFLGYKDGKVEVCIPKHLKKKNCMPDIISNVQDCPGYRDENPEIIGLDVHEAKDCHYIFVATHTSLYKLIITYPDYIKESLGLTKNSGAYGD